MSRYQTLSVVFSAFVLASFAAACGGDSGPRRTIKITQTDEGCTPASIDLATGEKVKFEVKNDGRKDREVEGIDGTKLEEVLVPSGRTRSLDYTAPGAAGTGNIGQFELGEVTHGMGFGEKAARSVGLIVHQRVDRQIEQQVVGDENQILMPL